MNKRTGKQTLALQLAVTSVEAWRRTRDETTTYRHDTEIAIRRAVDAGVSQSDIAEAVGWPRQRVHTLLNGR